MATNSLPFYQKLAYNLLTLFLLGYVLLLGQSILIPLFLAILLATLLLPVTNFLQRIHIPKIPAIILSIIVSLLIIGGIIYFLSHQISNFLQDFDTIKKRLNELVWSLQDWVDDTFNVSMRKQNQYIKDTAENIKDSGANIVGQTVVTITGFLSYVVFLPVYTFLILYYKDLIKRFLISVFTNGSAEKVTLIVSQSRIVAQYYVIGLLIDLTIVFTLNTIGFLILGIKYAVFLALLAALLNLIPYIGMLVANIFSMLITLVTSQNPADALWVAAVLGVVQIIDNNFLIPLVVGNKVRINALVTIVGVVIGGALCGIAGMFLAIPGIAVLKVLFDHVDSLKPWGILLGDDVTGQEKKKKKPIV